MPAMRVTASLGILFFAAIGACGESRPAARADTVDEIAVRRADSAREMKRALAEGTTADLVGDDNTCPTDTSVVHDDPIALVREYVRRDAAGTLQESEWVWGALTCIELTTSDYLAVVTSYTAEPLSVTSDTARVVIRFAPRFSLGYDSTGAPRLVPDTIVVAETAFVIRTRKGWRISEYPGGAHLYPSALLSRLPQINRADRQRVEALSARLGA
jgi:hypothetical protein